MLIGDKEPTGLLPKAVALFFCLEPHACRLLHQYNEQRFKSRKNYSHMHIYIYVMYRIIVEQMKMGGEKRAVYKGDQELGFQVIRSIASLLLDDGTTQFMVN
jgi:hypothetical protein